MLLPIPGNSSSTCLVVCCIRPAIAKLPPDGNSTVVCARRTLSAGIVRPGAVIVCPVVGSVVVPPCNVNAPVLVSSLTSRRKPAVKCVPALQDDRRKREANAELFEFNRDVTLIVTTRRHREFAASEETRRFARYGGEIGLGKDMDETDLIERLNDALENLFGLAHGIVVVLVATPLTMVVVTSGRKCCGQTLPNCAPEASLKA